MSASLWKHNCGARRFKYKNAIKTVKRDNIISIITRKRRKFNTHLIIYSLFKLEKSETLKLLLDFVLELLYKMSAKTLTVLNSLLTLNGPLTLNITMGLKTIIKLNITAIIIGILTIITETFKMINNVIITVKII